jgi:lipopolysaccharide heptosyltransferase II
LSRIAQPKIDLSAVERILLVRLRRIGDILMTMPAVRALRDRYPQAHMTYVVEEPYRALVEGSPDLDEVAVFPRHLSVGNFLRQMQPLREREYDILIDFHGGPRAFWITLFSRAGCKVGHRLKFKHLFYDLTLPRTGRDHSVEDHFNLVRAVGVERTDIPRLTMAPALEQEEANIEGVLQQEELRGRRIIALHVGAGNRFRDWGQDNLSRLISRLADLPDAAVALIGGPEDVSRSEFLAASQTGRTAALAGRLNLREVRELIRRADLFVGPDSGPMHIAATTDTPIVAYFGPTLPAHFSPWRAEASLLEKTYDCRPCRQRDCMHANIRCLREITPEEVAEAARRMLA